MQQFDFRVTTDLTVINPQEITCNYEETREWLENALAPYRGLVVTEDAISEAKSTRANIRKVRDAIDAQRKSVEREWNAPLAKFKEQAKELAAMCDEAALNIDGQVKAFQQKKADMKIAALRERYDELVTGFEDYISWDFVFNPKWANATFAAEDAEKEIEEKIANCVRDLTTIESLNSEFEEELFLEYSSTHDLRSVLEKERKLKELRENSLRQEQAAQEASAKEQKPKERTEWKQTVKENFVVKLRIGGTRAQLQRLRDFMDGQGISWQKI